MEEDEQAERTLPEWVELEYKAIFFMYFSSYHLSNKPTNIFSICEL